MVSPTALKLAVVVDFTRWSFGSALTSAKVHVVSRPTSTVMPSTLSVAEWNVPVEVVPSCNRHDAESRSQLLGTDSVTSKPVPAAAVYGALVPVPPDVVTDRATASGLIVKSNVRSPPVAFLTICRKPPPGVTMQSDGSLLAPLAIDG